MFERLRETIAHITVEGTTLEEVLEYDEGARTWFVAIEVVDPFGVERSFEVEFQYVELPEEDRSPPYLVVSWIMTPPPETPRQLDQNLTFLQAINDLNAEPGCKFRLSNDGRDNLSLLCDVSVPADFVTQPELQRAFERGCDMAMHYFEELQDRMEQR